MFSRKKNLLDVDSLSRMYNLDKENLKNLKKALDKKMKNKTVDRSNFQMLLQDEGIDKDDAYVLFDLLDCDSSGTLDVNELILMLALKCNSTSSDKNTLKLLFQMNDTNNSGTVEFKEFKRMINIYMILSGKKMDQISDATIEKLFNSIDRNSSGSISTQEFVTYLSLNPHCFELLTPRKPSLSK